MVKDRWVRWRNALLRDPRFHRWVARFPPTRLIARRRARALFNVVAGFVYSQVAAACVRLDLLTMLGERALVVDEIAERTGLTREASLCLLRAADSLKLVEHLGGERYALGMHGAALLGSAGVVEMIRHHDMLYADLADPVALLRRGGGGGRLAGFWPYASGESGADGAAYSALMARSQPLVAAQILDVAPLGRYRHLLDLGGGDGAFLQAVATRYPSLDLTLFDLPEVASRARVALADKATVIAGDFHTDPLPTGADAITLVRILHDHDDASADALLRAAALALAPGGDLIVAEPMAGDGSEAYFGFYLLAMGSGRPRTPREIGAMLLRAGFKSWRRLPTRMPISASVIIASR